MEPPAPIPRVALRHDLVHLFAAGLRPPEDEVQALSRLLGPDEEQRARQFHFARDGRRFVVGRAYLRLLLAGALCCHPEELRFQYGAYGKPALVAPRGGSSASFNLAHSGDLALFALSWRRAVGVDVEHTGRQLNIEALTRRYVEAAECAAIAALPEPQRRIRFFTFWTRREAFLKACGSGLAGGLDGIVVEADARGGQRIRRADAAEDAPLWTLSDLQLGDSFVGALVVAGAGYSVVAHTQRLGS